MMRLIQIIHPEQGRRIAKIDGNRCLLVKKTCSSIYALSNTIIHYGNGLSVKLVETEERFGSTGELSVDARYRAACVLDRKLNGAGVANSGREGGKARTLVTVGVLDGQNKEWPAEIGDTVKDRARAGAAPRP